MQPLLPPDEAGRLETLARYRILDTAREQHFDDVTRLAAHVCEAPTALISLIDRDRQWFKSRLGFEPAETSRDVSFCAHAILKPNDVLVVPDARKDPRFADNPLVTGDPGIRFYAGAPLVVSDGRALGTICVIDRVPRTLSSEQLAALRALRRMVVLELETRRQAEELEGARSDLEKKVEERSRALRESEELYRHLFEATDSLVQSVGPDGCLLLVNRAWRDKLGYTEAEAVGRHFESFLHRDCLDLCRAAFARVMRGEPVKDVAATFVAKDGREVLVEGSAAPRVVAGRVVASHGFFRDVTERKRAGEALNRQRTLLQAVVDSVEAGIVACDGDGALTLFNRAAREYHGLEHEAALPSPRWAESYGLYRADGETLMARDEVPLFRALSGETVRAAEVVIKPSGRVVRRLLVSGQPMLDDQGRKLGAVIAMQDITELMQAEDELRRQSEALQRSEKLAAMGELLAGVAHELNNPLAVVMGQASLLQRATRGTAQAERAEKIARAAERCARIVRNFLALARQQPPERSHVAINQAVEAALELVSYPLRSDGIEVKHDLASGLPPLWADDHQLQQVLINLLTNAHHALRQSQPPRRRVTVSTSHDPQRQRLLVEVSDTGPGIPPDVLPRIFEPFFTTKREGEGTGLGLPLCQGIVEAHGGSLSVESQPDRGTKFRIELPILPRPSAPAPTGEAAAGSRPRARSILVVDDEQEVRDVVADMLRQDGHQVETSANGAEALEKTKGRPFDLVLSDLRMPELDGPGLYQEIVRRQPGMQRRFVFMTGDTLTRATREFLERTPAAHVAKPFDQEQLRRAVEETIARA